MSPARPGWHALAALLGVLWAPGGVVAQGGLLEGSLLERWTLTWFSEGWAPRWVVAEPIAAFGRGSEAPLTRYHARLSGETLRLGSSLDQRMVRLDLFIRHPLNDRFAVIASSSSGTSESEAYGRPLLEEPRSQAGGFGVAVRLYRPESGPGVSAGFPRPTVTASALAGRDGGSPGFWGRLTVRGESYDLSLVRWTTTAREAHYFLPVDSLMDIGVQHAVDGAEIAGSAEVGVGGVRVRPEASWRVEILQPSGELRSTTFLYTSLGGRTDAATLGLAVADDARGGRATYRERRMDMDSGITRAAISAGWVSYARLGLTAWRLEGWTGVDRHRWTLALQRDRAWGQTSVRVETWPFVSLWESVSAEAYRLDGEITGRSETITLDRASLEGGWRWGVQAGRHRVQVLRDSWYVTSVGSGRTGEESTEGDTRRVYLVGLEGEKPFRIGGSTLSIRVTAQLPVHGEEDEDDPGSGAGNGAREPSGYLGVAASWSW